LFWLPPSMNQCGDHFDLSSDVPLNSSSKANVQFPGTPTGFGPVAVAVVVGTVDDDDGAVVVGTVDVDDGAVFVVGGTVDDGGAVVVGTIVVVGTELDDVGAVVEGSGVVGAGVVRGWWCPCDRATGVELAVRCGLVQPGELIA
jgi:hypothetical protein